MTILVMLPGCDQGQDKTIRLTHRVNLEERALCQAYVAEALTFKDGVVAASGLAYLLTRYSAPNDAIEVLQKLATVSPSEISRDVIALRDIVKRRVEGTSTSTRSSLADIVKSFEEDQARSTSFTRVDRWLIKHCSAELEHLRATAGRTPTTGLPVFAPGSSPSDPADGTVVASVHRGSPEPDCAVENGYFVIADEKSSSPNRIQFIDSSGTRRGDYSPSDVAAGKEVLAAIPAVEPTGRLLVAATTHSTVRSADAAPERRSATLALYDVGKKRTVWRVDGYLGADRSRPTVQAAIPVAITDSVVIALQRRNYGDGLLVGLSAKDGTVAWSMTTSDWRASFTESYDRRYLVIATSENKQAILRPKDGKVLVTLERKSSSRPVQVLREGVYVGEDGRPYVAGPDGATIRDFPTEGPSFIITSDGFLLSYSGDDGLVAWDLENGKKLWSIPRRRLDVNSYTMAAAMNGFVFGVISPPVFGRESPSYYDMRSLKDGSQVRVFAYEGKNILRGVQHGSHYLVCGSNGDEIARSFRSKTRPIAAVGTQLIRP